MFDCNWPSGALPALHLFAAALLALAVIAATSLYTANRTVLYRHPGQQAEGGHSPNSHLAASEAHAGEGGNHGGGSQKKCPKKLRAYMIEFPALVPPYGKFAPPEAHTAPASYLPFTEVRLRAVVVPQLLERPPPRGWITAPEAAPATQV